MLFLSSNMNQLFNLLWMSIEGILDLLDILVREILEQHGIRTLRNRSADVEITGDDRCESHARRRHSFDQDV